MPGFWAAAQPYVLSAVGLLGPLLTLLYAQRNRKQDTSRTAGQQLIDNLFKEKESLRADIDGLKNQIAELEAERDTEFEKRRALQALHDGLLAEWVAVGTTRAEQLEMARLAFQQRKTFNADNPNIKRRE